MTRAATSRHDGASALALPLALAVTLVLALPAAAQGQQIRATVDRSEIALDQQFLLTVTIEGVQDAVPVLPDLPDFRIVPRGNQQHWRIINGQRSQQVSHRYLLIPSRSGTFTIGPVTARVRGETLRSRPLEVRVLEEGREPEEDPEVFLTVSVSDNEPWVGEQILYTWRFYRRVRVADARLTSLEFGDVAVEELGEVREYDTNVRGVPYRVSELRRALFAQRPGEIEIPPATLTCEVAVEGRRRESFFDFGRIQTVSRELRSRPIQLQVRALPEAPADFSGLVGDFDIGARLSKDTLEVGESVTLELRISGTGNIQLMREPALPDLPSFKIYEDQPVTRIDRSGDRLGGTRVYSKALVPLEAGELTIAPVELVTFDPDAGRYRRSSTARLDLTVSPGERTEDLMLTESLTPTGGKVSVRVLAEDILPIRTDLELLERSGLRGLEGLAWWGLALLPPLAVLALLLVRSSSPLAAVDVQRRRRSAFRNAVAELEELRGRPDDAIPDLAGQAAGSLRGYVGAKLGLRGDALTPVEVENSLLDAGVDEGPAADARHNLERLEALMYGGDARRFTGSQLAQSVEAVIRELEGELSSGVGVDGRSAGLFGGSK